MGIENTWRNIFNFSYVLKVLNIGKLNLSYSERGPFILSPCLYLF